MTQRSGALHSTLWAHLYAAVINSPALPHQTQTSPGGCLTSIYWQQ